MNKSEIVERLIQDLEARLNLLIRAAVDAREAATGDEAKAENKYDTRGLEASYLAGAQAKRSEELTLELYNLKKYVLRKFDDTTPINLTALVTVLMNGEQERRFLILPYAGGSKIKIENEEIFVITPISSVGKLLLGKTVGDSFDLKSKENAVEYEIIKAE